MTIGELRMTEFFYIFGHDCFDHIPPNIFNNLDFNLFVENLGQYEFMLNKYYQGVLFRAREFLFKNVQLEYR